MWVYDANKGVVVTPGVTEHEFSNWSMDLRAQVSGGTVSTYSWSVTNAPDATNVSGSATYDLTFNWKSFTGAARTDTISVTETPTSGNPITQTLTFVVASTSSPAYTSTPPTSTSTWPTVLAPDALKAEQDTVGAARVQASTCSCSASVPEAPGHEPDYSLGLTAGEVRTVHHIHSYDPHVPPLHLMYSSMAANPLPVFIVHFPLDTSHSATPSTVSAQLTLNGSSGQNFYYDTSQLNPGDLMQIALQGGTALSTARYSYSITVVENYSPPSTFTYSGSVNIVNDASSPLGSGWSLDAVQRIWPVSGGVILEVPAGYSLWFANGQTSGTFVTPAGDFSTLTQNTSTGVYTRTLKDGTKINFNSSGYQTSVVDRNGNTTNFAYNGSNLLTTITDFNNLVTTFAYNGNNNVTSITDPANRTVTLSYDNASPARLTAVQDPDGDQWAYTYDSANHLTTLTNPRSFTTSFAYGFAGTVGTVTRADATTETLTPLQLQGLVPNGSGTQQNPATSVLAAQALASYTDARNNSWQTRSEWLGFGRATQRVDPLSDTSVIYRDTNALAWLASDPLARRTRSFFDGNGNPTTIVYPDDAVATYTYNSFSEPTKYTDPTNFTTTYNYDTNGNLTKVTDPLGKVTSYTYTSRGFVSTATDPLNHVYTYSYDSRSRVTSQADPLNRVTTIAYDLASNRTAVTDPRGNTINYRYDESGQLTQEIQPDATPATYSYGYDGVHDRTSVTDPLNHTVSYSFDRLNRLTSMTDALNDVTTYTYDGAGNPTSATDPIGRTITFAFDPANRAIAITDPLNHTLTYSYDSAGQLSTVTDPLGRVTNYGYTVRGWVQTVTNPAGDKFTYGYNAAGDKTSQAVSGSGGPGQNPNPGTETTTLAYDSRHLVTTAQDPAGNTTSYAYDSAYRQTKITDPLGHVTTLIYDTADQLSSQTDPLNHTVTYAYDGEGNVTSITDALGRVTSYPYDARNRQTALIDPRGGITSYAYDLASRLTTITDSVGNVTSYAYDAANRQTMMTDPLGTATYAYDPASQRTSLTDRDRRQRTFGFDSAGRLTNETWVNGSYTATYQYDQANQLTSATDPNSTYAYSYDSDRRLKSTDNQGTPGVPRIVLTYSYDQFNNRTTLTDSLGGNISYTYDADNRLASADLMVNSTQGPQITLAYDAASRTTSVTRKVSSTGSSITTAYNYDNGNRLTGITHTSSAAGTLATYTYGYDSANQVTSYAGADGSLTYTYDLAGELTAVGGSRSESYGYDLNGNRNTSGYQTGSGNRLLADGTYTYTYDAEGNLISRTRQSDGQLTTYTWDYRNRLTEVLIKSGTTTIQDDKFTYDVNGMRIGKSTFGGSQQWFAYDGANSYADFNSSGSLTYRYLYGRAIDALLARFDGTNAAWYLGDRLGSVRQLAQTSGTVLDTLTYDSYGNILSESSATSGDRFKYTSREWDSEISLQFNRARYYNPNDGRWTSEDPIGFGGNDSNLYRYVWNIPVRLRDPLGLACAMDGDLTNTKAKPKKDDFPYQDYITSDNLPDCAALCQKLSNDMRKNIKCLGIIRKICLLGAANECQKRCAVACNDDWAKFNKALDALKAGRKEFLECKKEAEERCKVVGKL
jgi:RHS repeat-associated protein